MAAASSLRGHDHASTVIEAFKDHYRNEGRGVTICAHPWPHGCVYVVPDGPDGTRRGQRHIAIELFTGSVCVDEHLCERLGAAPRPTDPTDPDRRRGVRISSAEPLGTSCGTNYGRFGWGITFEEIEHRWGSVREFVEEVADILSGLPRPGAG